MLVITVARKPLEGTVARNVLQWGTGAINIDKSRIRYVNAFDQASAIPQGRATAKVGALAGGQQNDRERSGFVPDNTKGRWPANFVLQHLQGCTLDGTRPVKSNGHFPSARRQGGLGTAGHTGQEGLEERHLDGESIDSWVCQEGCPVLGLDQQSGVPTNTSHHSYKRSGGEFIGGIPSQTEFRHWHTETGTASRFFRHVKP